MNTAKSADSIFSSAGTSPAYEVTYSLSGNKTASLVKSYSIIDLFRLYGDHLWDDGKHKYNVTFFLAELDEIASPRYFSTFSQEALDHIVAKLRARGNSNATINRKVSALRKLLRKSHRMGTIHSLPEFKREKERAGRIRFLEDDEEDRLFSSIAIRSADYHHLALFLVDTGARLGEALGLRWNDIHNERVTFWLTKSGRSRSVPLTRRAMQAVQAQAGNRRGPFAGIQAHKFRAAWNEAKAEIGLGSDADVVPHILRHTCASRLVRGGVDIRRVQMWLGHQTLAMTMRYAHLATNDLDVCVPILERRAPPTPDQETQDVRSKEMA